MLHIDSADRSMLGDLVTEDGILPGELIFAQEGGGFRRAAGTDQRVDGVVEDFADDHIAEHDEDFRASMDAFSYDASEGDSCAIGGGEDAARLRLLLPEDDGTSSAPSIQQWSVVVIPDIAGFEGRIVEEGYSPDGGTTVYDRASGNVNPVGIAAGSDPKTHLPSGGYSEWDGMIHVIFRTDL